MEDNLQNASRVARVVDYTIQTIQGPFHAHAVDERCTTFIPTILSSSILTTFLSIASQRKHTLRICMRCSTFWRNINYDSTQKCVNLGNKPLFTLASSLAERRSRSTRTKSRWSKSGQGGEQSWKFGDW